MTKRPDDFYQVDVKYPDGSVSVVSVAQSGGEVRIRSKRDSHLVHPKATSIEQEIEAVFGVEVIGRHASGRP